MTRSVMLVLVAVLAAVVGVLTQATGALRAIERDTVDARFAIRADHTVPEDVVVVGFDQGTYRRLKSLPPFPRRFHARAIEHLEAAGATAIAYDIEFVKTTTVRDDNALFLAIRRAGNVVLATTMGLRKGRSPVLGGSAPQARATVGFAGYPTDRGAVLRRVYARREGQPTFAAAAAGRAPPDGGAWIDYRGNPSIIPLWKAVDGRLPDLTGKTVVVGDTDVAGHDYSDTSVGVRFGAEINAAAIDTLLRDDPLRDLPGGVATVVLILLAAAVPLSAVRLTGLRWLPVAGVVLVAWPLAAQLLFDAGHVLPLIPGLAGALTGFAGALVVTYGVELRTRRRLREQFGRFVPAAVVDTVVDRAGSIAALPGVRREGTVLFADLRGFTTLAESLGAEQVFALLDRYLSDMGDGILNAGGTVVSYMGDGLMGVFGAPLELPDHADRALVAARDMLGPRLAAFNDWLREQGVGEGVQLAVGLATGPVMSGTVGSARRVEYAAVGDTTNLAARLETMTRETGRALHLSDATRAALATVPADLEEVGELAVRGRAEHVRVWTIRQSS